MANPFDQFDSASGGNPFDQFDQPTKKADPKIGQPEELTFGEKYVGPALNALTKLATGQSLDQYAGGNLRGSAVGGLMQGAADPGVKIAQLAANLTPFAKDANQAVQAEEQKYQDARQGAGRDGMDLARIGGNALITAPLGGVGGAPTTLLGLAGKGALQGGIAGALQPITNGGENFWKDTAKDTGVGAGVGGVAGPLMGALARVISPEASVNPKLQLLRDEGVRPTVGQTLGGVANSMEEKAQSLPFIGSAIQNARGRAAGQLEDAAYARAADPIGATIKDRGYSGISELEGELGKAYDTVLPKLSVNVLDPQFVSKLSNLRQMVQSLPAEEARQFDNILSREIDGRVQPNGTLSGQALKDAWNALRDKSKDFMGSNDAYQKDLGRALKQTFQELKDQVTATNNPADVFALKSADFGYANFKRLQRAASSVGAEDGRFTPAQLQNAVKAMDRSKDKAAFASGDALMQDLSSAGKSILGGKVPNSGTADRGFAGGLVTGMFNPAAAGGMVLSGGAYTAPVQNALTALIAKRPDQAPEIANMLRRLMGPAAFAAVPAVEQR